MKLRHNAAAVAAMLLAPAGNESATLRKAKAP